MYKSIAGPLVLTILLTVACAGGNGEHSADSLGIEAARIEAHMRSLAADDLQGRETGSAGHVRAAEYVAAQFEELGLEPAGTEGGYYQSVPLVSGTLLGDESRLTLIRDGARSALENQVDFVLWPDPLRQSSELTAPLAYVGFGVRAPDLEYDDYAGIDVVGKIVVMLDGAPPYFPNDERAFNSKMSMKMQVAAELGAVGVVTMMLPRDRTDYPWEAVVDAGMSAMRWLEPDGRPHGVYEEIFFIASLSSRGAQKLFDGEAHTIEQLFAAAESGETFSLELTSRLRAFSITGHERLKSSNVIARLPGSDPALAGEHVVVMAHLDHVGSVPVEAGKDGIHNGAYDNASGVAVLLEVAATLAAAPDPLRRSVLFIALTGKEKGLLGSEYFVEYPTVELDALVAAINLDMVLMLHPLKDVVAFGAEHSTFETVVGRAAAQIGVEVAPDPIPGRVLFVRSDPYPFVTKGIPSVFLFSGFDGGPNDGLEQFDHWMRTVYHTPVDDMDQAIDFEAGADFARILRLIVTDVANAEERPSWNAGDSFGDRFGK